jgi:octaprenyl-diphosphate synthase
VIAAIERTGALQYTRRQAEAEAREAEAALEQLPVSKQRDYLLQLAGFAVSRNF